MPRLTIGVPTYNNAATLRATIESLLAQTFGDFRLVVSDDSSTDGTQDVCLDLASLDKRIEYIRQPENLKYQNFGYLLRRAATEYFMWGAGDDRWRPTFAESCVRELDASPQIVLAVSKVRFERAGKPARLAGGTYPLTGSLQENLVRYFSAPSDNSRMYGVFRTMAGQCSFPAQSFHAYDWAFSAATLRFGGHAEIPEVLMYRDETPWERYIDLARADSASAVDRLLPLRPMTAWLLREGRVPKDRRVLGALLALNVDKHIEYVGQRHPAYYKCIAPLEAIWRRRVRWRLTRPFEPGA